MGRPGGGIARSRRRLTRQPGLMGQGLGAVFPVVVVGIVANLLVNLLLGLEIMGLGRRARRAVVKGEGGLRGGHRNQGR